jgi:hypothetical protein
VGDPFPTPGGANERYAKSGTSPFSARAHKIVEKLFSNLFFYQNSL